MASPECPPHIQQRARYELVIATFLGTRDFRPVEDVARAYLDESLSETEPARLQDASALLLYANTAVRWGCTSLSPSELGDWNERLTRRVQDLVAHETPHRRASLLFAIGHLGLHPALWEVNIQDFSDEAQVLDQQDQIVDLSALANVSMPDGVVFADVSRTLSAWTELMENLGRTPLFPIQSLADILQMLVPLWSSQAEWRQLLDLVDEAVGERSGKHVLGDRARDRATKLLHAGRYLDALEEFHRAKIEWWSGEMVRGSLLAMMVIARLYFELRLPQASKSYALAVAYVAASRRDEALVDLVPAGLLMAASADFVAGAWCSAVELYELGLDAQHEYIEDGFDWEKHTAVKTAALHLVYVNACSKIVDSDLAALIGATTGRIGAQELIDGAIDVLNAKGSDFWESLVDIGLVARPFADIGDARYIRFSGLGTDWTLVAANDTVSVRAAERFAAAAQVMLAALAQNDLCLVQSRINVRIEIRRAVLAYAAELIESLPSNNGREWVIRLAPVETDTNPEDIDTELLTMLIPIRREATVNER